MIFSLLENWQLARGNWLQVAQHLLLSAPLW